MEIEVGEYIRTNKGIAKITKNSIGKIDYFTYYDIDKEIDDINYIQKEDVIKHSKNIIDLIEVRRLCKWKKN